MADEAVSETRASDCRRPRRWLKRSLALGLLVSVVSMALLALLLTPAAGVIIRPKLEKELGIEAVGGSLRFDLNGDVIIRNVAFHVPESDDRTGPRGDAARFLLIRRGQITLWWRAKLRGQSLLRAVDLFDAELRLTKPLDDFDLNILAIEPPDRSGGQGGSLPKISVYRADVLLGEHNADGEITELRTLPMVASLRPSRETPDAYEVSAEEDPQRTTSTKPLRFEGALSPDGFTGRLNGIDMADFPPEAIPQQLRQVYSELQISGRTRGATVRFDEQLDVLELTLDFQTPEGGPAPLAEDSEVAGFLNLRVPVPTDEQGTLEPLIPATGSGKVRLVQRPSPQRGGRVDWGSLQAPQEPGEPGVGQRTLMVEALLDATIEDAAVTMGVRLWLGGAEPLYEFDVQTTEPYRIDGRRPWLGRPAPVLEKISGLRDLLGAEATVSLNATIAQIADGQGVVQSVEGFGEFWNGAMAFEYFPYPVSIQRGTIELDDAQIRVFDIEGVTPSGAPVRAATTVSLDKVATGVAVDVQALGVPYDDTMRQTLDKIAPEIRDTILNEQALEALVDQRLLRHPGRFGRAPAFSLGGRADATVRVRRTAGVQGSTTVDVHVNTESFGLLPEAFAVPLVAQDVALEIHLPSDVDTTRQGKARMLQIRTSDASATTLAGGRASVDVSIDVPIERTDDEALSTSVDLRVLAQDVPVHPQLLAAVPGGSDAEDDGPLPDGPRGLLRALNARGTIDAEVSVVRDDRGAIDWHATISPDGLSFSPQPLDPRDPLEVLQVAGSVRVDADGVEGTLEGRTRRGGRIRSGFQSAFDRDWVDASFTAEDLNLESPVEDAIAVVSPSLGRALAEARATFDVQGRADLATTVLRENGEAWAQVDITAIDRLRFDWLDGRMGIDGGQGLVRITTTEGGPIVSFDRLRADGSYEGEALGRVRLRGHIPLDALRESGSRYGDATTLSLEVEGGSLDSRLLRALARNRAGGGFESVLEDVDLRGEYDALVTIDTPAYESGGQPSRPLRSFELSPYDASFRRAEGLVRIPWLSGVVQGRELAPSEEGPGGSARYEGTIEHLTLGGDGWWIGLDGYWRADGQQIAEMEVFLDGQIAETEDASGLRFGLPEAIPGLMPTGVAKAFDAIALEAGGEIEVDTGRLRVVARRRQPIDVEFDAGLQLARLGMGQRASKVPEVHDVREEGSTPSATTQPSPARIATLEDVRLDILSESSHPSRRASLRLEANQGRAWGLPVSGLSAEGRVTTDRSVVVDRLRVGTAGGRIAGRGLVEVPDAAGEQARYELDVSGAGLHTEQLIAALLGRPPAEQDAAGDMDLSLGIAGSFGDAETMRGRGSVRIRGGSPVELPLAIRAAVEVLNVNFGADRYDAMNAEFFIRDRMLTFTDLTVSSPSVVLEGLGTVGLEDGALDFAITTRPANDSAIKTLVRSIRDVIVGVELRGTLDEPSPAPRPQALVGPFDRLRRILQGGMNYDEWRRERLRQYGGPQQASKSGW